MDFGQAQADARRYLRALLPAAQPSQKARVWIDGRAGDDVQPSDPSRDHHDFSWLFRWRARTASDAEVKGFIEIDHEGKLRSFRRLDPAGRDPRLIREPETFRARAADLARTLVGFDTAHAIARSETRFDADGNPYLHVDWTATQPDEVGYRTAAVDLSANGVRALGTSYGKHADVPIPTTILERHPRGVPLLRPPALRLPQREP